MGGMCTWRRCLGLWAGGPVAKSSAQALREQGLRPGRFDLQVQEQLVRVQQIQAVREGAFAAIRDDGFVVTWGDPQFLSWQWKSFGWG